MPGHLLPAIAVVAAVSLAGTVWPASQPKRRAAANPTVDVAPAIVKRGHAITVTGSRWRRRATVELLIGPPRSEGTHVATVRTTSTGTFKRKLTPPAFVQARTGRWVLLACRRECRIKAVHSFRVTR